MAIVEPRALAPLDLPGRRLIAALAGFAIMTATAFMLRRAAPEASSIIPLACAGLAGLSVGALALTLEDDALPKLTRGVLAGSGLLSLALSPILRRGSGYSAFASVAFGAALALWLARTAQDGRTFRCGWRQFTQRRSPASAPMRPISCSSRAI